ncbi:MAG: DUF1648 domain-containing protein [Erysipelotrichaceae bacterium]
MKVKSNRLDIFKNILSVIFLVSVFCYLLFNWGNFPEQIPGHYNAAGVIDRWGSKVELLAFPIVAFILYLLITLIERFPQIWNTGVNVNEENKARVYATLKSMIVTVKLITVVLFCYLFVMQSTATSLPSWFLPLFLILEFGSIAFYIVKLIRIK